LADFKGRSLPYFTTHADLVQRQAARKASQKAVNGDTHWTGDEFVKQSDALTKS
jgi:dihydropyrimidine dehydrogenase (NADP+)/dihydropyrimidine dehydrogenase (NAD+) subunit PreA